MRLLQPRSHRYFDSLSWLYHGSGLGVANEGAISGSTTLVFGGTVNLTSITRISGSATLAFTSTASIVDSSIVVAAAPSTSLAVISGSGGRRKLTASGGDRKIRASGGAKGIRSNR